MLGGLQGSAMSYMISGGGILFDFQTSHFFFISTLPTFSNERNPQLQIIQHYNLTDQINNNQPTRKSQIMEHYIQVS